MEEENQGLGWRRLENEEMEEEKIEQNVISKERRSRETFDDIAEED